MTRELIILAMGPTKMYCPYDAEVWGLNTGWKTTNGRKLDKLFLAHKQVYSQEGAPYFDWEEMNNLGTEIISLHDILELKAIRYPLERISRKFRNYFSNTICYMIAYALDLCTDEHGKLLDNPPYNHLKLYGCDFQTGSEYTEEKGGVEFWLGIATGLGITCEIAPGGTLLQTITGYPYGAEIGQSSTKLNVVQVPLPTKAGVMAGCITFENIDWDNIHSIKDLLHGGAKCRVAN